MAGDGRIGALLRGCGPGQDRGHRQNSSQEGPSCHTFSLTCEATGSKRLTAAGQMLTVHARETRLRLATCLARSVTAEDTKSLGRLPQNPHGVADGDLVVRGARPVQCTGTRPGWSGTGPAGRP